MKADVRESPAYMMWLASNAWQRGLRRVLEPWNLTHVQFAVLSSVERLGGEGACLCQAEVARWLDIDENMNSQVIRSLERRKLLERHQHPSDRRAHKLVLTPEGHKITLEARGAVKQVGEQFFAPLGDRQSELVGLLSALVDPQTLRPCSKLDS